MPAMQPMQVLYPHCAFLDVHKQTVVACVRHLRPDGTVDQQVRTFSTMPRNLLELADWLAGEQVSHVAMESTGVFWKPVFNLLEGVVPNVWVVNARDMKQVPGRKTDVSDSQWGAQLLQCGLLRPSFVPEKDQRQLRDLTRYRWQVMREKSRLANRIQKVLEDANLKLSSVATDVLGASGRAMIQAIIAGQSDPAALAELARHRLRAKIPQLREALAGRVEEHHRFMLKTLMEHLEALEKQVEALDRRIEEVMSPLMKDGVKLLDQIPGIDVRAAQNILAEIGTDMSRFPTAAKLSSWGGLCPGNHCSAGKSRGGRSREGNRWLKATLGQCAWAASRTKGTYLSALYWRIAKRRGCKRAVMAVGHSMLEAAWHMLSTGAAYQELGADYFDRLDPERKVKRLISELEHLGYKANLEKLPAA